jgi:hypothetical protein
MLAYKMIVRGEAVHAMIPDSPTVESERRQFFFGAAIGIPTFYVRKNSANRFLLKILQMARGTRSSRRYAGYLRIPAVEYRLALIRLLRQEAADLVEMMQLWAVVDDLERRIREPRQYSCAGRLTQGILDGGGWSGPFSMDGSAFNQAAEEYYRERLRKRHIREAFGHFREAVRRLDGWPSWRSGIYNQALLSILGGASADDYLASVERAVMTDDLPETMCEKLIYLILLLLHQGKGDRAQTAPDN